MPHMLHGTNNPSLQGIKESSKKQTSYTLPQDYP